MLPILIINMAQGSTCRLESSVNYAMNDTLATSLNTPKPISVDFCYRNSCHTLYEKHTYSLYDIRLLYNYSASVKLEGNVV